MRLSEMVRAFSGAMLVYVAMAACGADDGVGDAKASSPTAESVTEQCSVFFENGVARQAYAAHLYPGVSATDLARQVIAVGAVKAGAPPTFTNQVVGIWTKDGVVGAPCGPENAKNFDSITFIRTM